MRRAEEGKAFYQDKLGFKLKFDFSEQGLLAFQVAAWNNRLLFKHTYKGQKVVIGTHGAVMTFMMRYFDTRYDLDFLLKTSKPDIYRMEFNEDVFVETKRIWKDL